MKRTQIGLITGLFTLAAVAGAKDISVAELGLGADGIRNATPYVRRAIDEVIRTGGGTVRFPKGIYQFNLDGSLDGRPYVSNNQDDFPKAIAMPITGATGLIIDGCGSLFLLHHKMMGVAIESGSNVTLKSFALDYTRPIHSDSTLTEIRDNDFTLRFEPEITWRVNDRGAFRFMVDGEAVADWSGYAFGGKTGQPKYRASENFGKALATRTAVEIAPGLVRFSGTFNKRFEVGDRITFRHNNRNHVGIFIHKSKNTVIEGVTIHHAAAMGVVGQRSENISLERVRVEPRGGSGRVSTTIADATHFSGCRGLIRVTDSHFEGMMDDAINVHGTSLQVGEIPDDHTIVAKFMHDQSKGFEIASQGDEIRFIDNETLLQLGQGFSKAVSVTPLDIHQVKIVFAEPLPAGLKVGHAIENITWTPEVYFAGNEIIKNRARGMLFNTPRKCLVEQNRVSTSGSALLVAGDANGWFESGAAGEFGPTIIRNNVFENCLFNMYQFCNAVISIDPEIPHVSNQGCYHRNIEITGNTFRVFDAPLVYAKSVEGLKIEGNTFERTNAYEPWHPNRKAIVLDHCRDVSVKGNQVRGELLDRSISLESTPADQVRVAAGEPFQP